MVSEDKVFAYTYDGWRFQGVEFTVDHDSFATGCKITLRHVHEGNKAWLGELYRLQYRYFFCTVIPMPTYTRVGLTKAHR